MVSDRFFCSGIGDHLLYCNGLRLRNFSAGSFGFHFRRTDSHFHEPPGEGEADIFLMFQSQQEAIAPGLGNSQKVPLSGGEFPVGVADSVESPDFPAFPVWG